MIFLDNGIKYGKKGGKIWVKVYAEKGRVLIKIKDNGVGIKKEDQKFIFDRFWQGDKSRNKGYGLGLSVAKKIIDEHRGSVSVESELGRGSEFVIRL
jgi:signal transduction histidine kinase